MRGTALPAWRRAHGYPTQDGLRRELGIGSRGTISAWENAEGDLPRMLELALLALAEIPAARNVAGFEDRRSRRAHRLAPAPARPLRARDGA